MELAVKLEAALVAYLAGLNPPYPAYFDKTEQIRPGESAEAKDQQYLRCRTAENADEEYPLDTGNFWWPCEVELRTPSALQTEAEASEEVSNFDRHQAMAAILEEAILVDDLAAQLTAAAAALGEGYELTVMAVQARQPASAQEDDVYSSGWTFRVYCCSRSFS